MTLAPPEGRRFVYPYRPSPVQARAHALDDVDELLYGGAAGGGKTDYALAEAVRVALSAPGVAVLILRRTFPDLYRPNGIIFRLRQRLPARLAKWNGESHTFTFPNGSVIEVGHCARDADVLKYQGSEYALVIFDELTQFSLYQYLYLRSRLRVAGRLVGKIRPRSIGTTNPGGPGHGWVRGRFIDPAPPLKVWTPPATEDEPRPRSRVFVPAKLADNPHVDPGYEDTLRGLGDPALVRALLTGDWDVFAGQRFAGWRRDIHEVEPEALPIPAGVPRGIGVDYGFDAPFVALWGARLADDLVVVYRELVAVGLTPSEQAEAILRAEMPGERATYRAPVHIDPSTYARNPSQPKAIASSPHLPPPGSIAAAYALKGLPVRRANNDRLLGVATVADKLRVRGDGRPRLLVYSSCRYLISSLPSLPRDPKNPEDVDTKADDHAYDALRYLLLGAGSTPAAPPSHDERRRELPVAETHALRTSGF
jgi:hypothetical protein